MARQPAPKRVRVCRVTRERTLPADGGRTLFFRIDGIARRARFADPGQVPAFEGEQAFFEVEARPKAALGYVFIREVEKPAGWSHWC
jgi:hypothetical protein